METNTKHFSKQSVKNVIKLRRSKSMKISETTNDIKGVLNRHCTETLKKSRERKAAHPEYTLRQKEKKGNIIAVIEKKISRLAEGRRKLFEDHQK